VISKIYPLSFHEREELQKFLDKNLASGQIRLSTSPFACPFFFRKKPNGTLQPIVDYWALNDIMIKNKYLLPLISDLVERLSSVKIFRKMDLWCGFNNLWIKEGDEAKAVFIMHQGLYEPTVMQFRLCIAPASFQNMMNEVLKEEKATGRVVVYINNILIFMDRIEEHQKLVVKVLEKLRRNWLFCQPEKCNFKREQINFLGVEISEGMIHMSLKKIEVIQGWPVPMKKKDMQAFLGFANFYRRFIWHFGKIAKPLHGLTGNSEWKWGNNQ
jgi:hypothetical protein